MVTTQRWQQCQVPTHHVTSTIATLYDIPTMLKSLAKLGYTLLSLARAYLNFKLLGRAKASIGIRAPLGARAYP